MLTGSGQTEGIKKPLGTRGSKRLSNLQHNQERNNACSSSKYIAIACLMAECAAESDLPRTIGRRCQVNRDIEITMTAKGVGLTGESVLLQGNALLAAGIQLSYQ